MIRRSPKISNFHFNLFVTSQTETTLTSLFYEKSIKLRFSHSNSTAIVVYEKKHMWNI